MTPDELWFDYFGLNHLGWLRGVRDAGGAQLLDGLLEDDARLTSFEEGRLFGPEWLRSLGMIPNEYLYYFYYAADTVNAIRGSAASRGHFLLEQQRAFYAQNGQGGATRWPPGAPPATTASARTWPRPAPPRVITPSTTTTPTPATRARRWRCWRRSRSTAARC